MILVVGATGQLGAACVRKLLNRGNPVRALARTTSSYQHLERAGIELVFGDLRDTASLFTACENVETVIATANAAVPSQPGDTFKAVDGQGYRNLIEACGQQGVRRFVFTSVAAGPMEARYCRPSRPSVMCWLSLIGTPFAATLLFGPLSCIWARLNVYWPSFD